MKMSLLPALALSAGLLAAAHAVPEPELVPLTPLASATPVASAAASPTPASSASATPAGDENERKALVLPASELAKFLPPAPPEWKIGEATASDDAINQAPGSTARHFYVSNSDPAGDKTGVEIQISDWINSAKQLRTQLRLWSYTNEKDESGYVRGQVVGGYPAQETWVAEGQEHTLTLIVGGRYLVEVTTNQQPPEALMQWLNHVDLKTLAATKPKK